MNLWKRTPEYVTNIGPGSGARVPARSWLHSDAPRLDLNGEWSFRLSPTASESEEFAQPEFDASSWDQLAVPSHWVLSGLAEGSPRYGLPAYTNVQMPIPLDPPNVPDENPTGDYRRGFEVPEEWLKSGAVYLRLDGVESTYKVWLNGVEIGVGKGSRLAQEFDLASALRPGRNVLAIRVHQWSAATYLEDQDQWWLPGIFRDVTVLHRPAAGIEDVWVNADYDVESGHGSLRISVRANASAFPVSVKIEELGFAGEVSFAAGEPDGGAESHQANSGEVEAEAIFDVGPVEPWSAEVPRLYTVKISNSAEEITQRTGFRHVEIRGDQFLVNGTRVVFHGVNRHETHPLRGRVFDEDHARADLELMKRNNINAIRTSHYPPHPRVLDLADELGFWVILECDLETHGLWVAPTVVNSSEDPAWQEAYVDRMERTVERDKNHPSIVMWSLGNESGTGVNMAAMAAWANDRDPGRPFHYEGDYRGQYTDVYSRMYSPIPEVESIGLDLDGKPSTGQLHACSIAEGIVNRSKPFLLCEYIHAMGNGPGAADLYEELVWKYPRVHGGFVWEWRDHGLLTRDANGQEFYGYGGDFGEVIHDGNFVMDGLVLSSDQPSPGLTEFAAVVAPVKMSFQSGDSGEQVLHLHNRRHTLSTADLNFRWRLEIDGRSVSDGELELPELAAGDFAEIPVENIVPEYSVPEGSEAWLTVEASYQEDQSWAPAGYLVSRAQHRLAAAPASMPRKPRAGVVPLDVAETGTVHVGQWAVPLPTLQLWRAPIDNERLSTGGSYDDGDPYQPGDSGVPGWGKLVNGRSGPAVAEQWVKAGLNRLRHRVESVSEGDGWQQRVVRSAPDNSGEFVLTTLTWSATDAGVLLTAEISPSLGWKTVWPRIGLKFELPSLVESVQWFGLGPGESYPDSKNGVYLGRFESAAVELPMEYSRPQENGHRSEFRELTLQSPDGDLKVRAFAEPFGGFPGFTLSSHTAEELTAAGHPHELPPSNAQYLYVDAAQHGLGSRACGPDVWPDAQLRPRAARVQLLFSQS